LVGFINPITLSNGFDLSIIDPDLESPAASAPVTATTGNTFTDGEITMPGALKKIHDGSMLVMLYHK
jgi:hypothetical protein